MVGYTSRMDRYWSKVKKSNGCWQWTGAVSSSGYGSFYYGDGISMTAHKAVCLLSGIDVPTGSDVHHTCRNRLCVNPDHLEVVAHATHAGAHTKTVCKHGHEFTPENTSWVNRKNRKPEKRCKKCHRNRNGSTRRQSAS